MLKEPRFRLFDGSLNLGIAMNAEVTVRDKIGNNNSVGCGDGLVGDIWSRDRDRFGFGDLNGDLFVNLRTRASRRSESMKDSRDATLESPRYRSDPQRLGRGRFLCRHLRRTGEEPRYSENGLSKVSGGPEASIDIVRRL
jgi:hypothetical protein